MQRSDRQREVIHKETNQTEKRDKSKQTKDLQRKSDKEQTENRECLFHRKKTAVEAATKRKLPKGRKNYIQLHFDRKTLKGQKDAESIR